MFNFRGRLTVDECLEHPWLKDEADIPRAIVGVGLETQDLTDDDNSSQQTDTRNGINGLNGHTAVNGVNGVNGINGINGISSVKSVNGACTVNGVDAAAENGINGHGPVNGVVKEVSSVNGVSPHGAPDSEVGHLNGVNGVNRPHTNGVNGHNNGADCNGSNGTHEARGDHETFTLRF